MLFFSRHSICAGWINYVYFFTKTSRHYCFSLNLFIFITWQPEGVNHKNLTPSQFSFLQRCKQYLNSFCFIFVNLKIMLLRIAMKSKNVIHVLIKFKIATGLSLFDNLSVILLVQVDISNNYNDIISVN